MSNSVETVASSLNGNFKNVYGAKIMDLVPESDILLRDDRIQFVTKKGREGIQFNQPVLLSLPSSATWGLGGPTLNSAIAMQMGNATVAGSAITMRDVIAYDAAARAASSEAAFEATVGLVIRALFKAHSKFCELDLLYGNGALTTSGISMGTGTVVVTSGSNAAMTINYSSWAPALWSGFQNASVDAYTGGSKINTNAALSIVSVNVNPTSSTVGGVITLSGNATDITNLINDNGSTIDLYWFGAYGNNMVGLKGIMTNTGSLFGISATTYDLWLSNTFDCTSTQLTFSKLQQAVALAVSRGLDEPVITLCNPVTFADLVNEQAGARRYDSSYGSKKQEVGTEALTFWSPAGKMEVLPHIFCHQGEAFVFPPDELIKVGPMDKIAPTLPGMGELFFQSPLAASYEIRSFSDMALLLNAPAKATYIKNITNSVSA